MPPLCVNAYQGLPILCEEGLSLLPRAWLVSRIVTFIMLHCYFLFALPVQFSQLLEVCRVCVLAKVLSLCLADFPLPCARSVGVAVCQTFPP